jgi:RimK family alpha-L-glutamate ligase
MKGLVVSNGFRELKATEYKIKRLREEFGLKGVQIDSKTSFDLDISYKDSQVVFPGSENYAFCIYLDKDETLAYMIDQKVPVFNTPDALAFCNDKMETFYRLTGAGLKMPLTIPSRLCYRPEEENDALIEKFCAEVAQKLSFPLVCKNCFGSLGLQVYLISNMEELIAKYKELLLVPHLYQQYVPSSFGKDFRIFTVGGKAVAWMERVNQTDFRSNIALGGKGFLVEPPQGFKEAAEKASKLLGLDYAGVDLLIGPDEKPWLSEVNSNAFFTEIEAVSGVNVTRAVVERILSSSRLKK